MLKHDISIKTVCLKKKFCHSLRRNMFYGLSDICLLGRGRTDHLRLDEFWALDKVTFSAKSGDIIGVIGPNGCGKSTLMRLLAGVYKLDSGTLSIVGEIVSFFAVNIMIVRSMSVIEVIYFLGSFYGISSRDIDLKLSAILEFGGLDSIKDRPYSKLSTGMKLRVLFSTIQSIEFNILLIDEALNASDVTFRIRCINRIQQLKDRCLVIVVSHNLELIGSLCNRLLIMNDGKIISDTHNVQKGLEVYAKAV